MSSLSAGQSLGERFAGLRTPRNQNFFNAIAEHLSPIADDPCVEMYFTYAITANDRGRAVATLLEKHARLSNARYLDIGCAYAGFLVAFAERGARVTGVEIAPHLIDLARANLSDAGFEADILRRDATRLTDMIEFCNRIDLVTCNDVIEHVEDPHGLLSIISLILRSQGVAYFEIPNRYYPRFVVSDGHYGLFGITLLDFEDAKEYFHIRHPDRIYDTRYYLELDQYATLFDRAGLRMTVMKESLEGVSLDTIDAGVKHLRENSDALLNSVPTSLAGKVSAALSDYLREVDRARSSGQRQEEFVLRYGPSFWRVLGRKP